MLPWIMMSLRAYSPYITLPFAAIIGFIGYNLESLIRDPSPHQRPSVKDERNERLLTEILESKETKSQFTQTNSPPKTIFDKNLSPSLAK